MSGVRRLERWCVVSFVEPAAEAFTRDAWPLHVTLVPPFEAEPEAIEVAIGVSLAGVLPVETHVVAEERFGRRKEVRVGELARTDGSVVLHEHLLGATSAAGVDLGRLRHVGAAFRPHVSVQQGRGLAVGTEIVLDHVALVAMRPDGDPRRRRVVRTWPLG